MYCHSPPYHGLVQVLHFRPNRGLFHQGLMQRLSGAQQLIMQLGQLLPSPCRPARSGIASSGCRRSRLSVFRLRTTLARPALGRRPTALMGFCLNVCGGEPARRPCGRVGLTVAANLFCLTPHQERCKVVTSTKVPFQPLSALLRVWNSRSG